MRGRNCINKEKMSEKLFPAYELSVSDIVKFSGTRNDGIRRIIEIRTPANSDGYSYYCQVMKWNGFKFSPTDFTSTNGREKLTHVYKDGHWMKIIDNVLVNK